MNGEERIQTLWEQVSGRIWSGFCLGSDYFLLSWGRL